jgi:hypothetical protein
VVFALQNALSAVTSQAAMYAQAPAAQTGTAAGLLRTPHVFRAIASAGITGSGSGGHQPQRALHPADPEEWRPPADEDCVIAARRT